MTIQVTCDNCGKVVKAKDEYAGKKGKCPGCGSILLMPAPKTRHAEAEESQFPWQNESVPAQKTRHNEALAAMLADDDASVPAPKTRHTAGGGTASPSRTSTPLRETRDSSPEPPSRRKPTPEDRPVDATGTKTCPACAEVIKAVATKCRYCGEVLVAANNEPSTQFPEFPTDTGFAGAAQTTRHAEAVSHRNQISLSVSKPSMTPTRLILAIVGIVIGIAIFMASLKESDQVRELREGNERLHRSLYGP